jgi:hypothetical protein
MAIESPPNKEQRKKKSIMGSTIGSPQWERVVDDADTEERIRTDVGTVFDGIRTTVIEITGDPIQDHRAIRQYKQLGYEVKVGEYEAVATISQETFLKRKAETEARILAKSKPTGIRRSGQEGLVTVESDNSLDAPISIKDLENA